MSKLRRVWDRISVWWLGEPPHVDSGDVIIVWGHGPPFVERLRDRLNWIPNLRWEVSLPGAIALYALALAAISVPVPSFLLAVVSVWLSAALIVFQAALWLVRHQAGLPIARLAVFVAAWVISIPATNASLAWVDRSQREYAKQHEPPVRTPLKTVDARQTPYVEGEVANPSARARTVPRATPNPKPGPPPLAAVVVATPPPPSVTTSPPPSPAPSDELLANARPFPEPSVPTTTPFSAYSDQSLRNRVMSKCAQLRSFENAFNADTKAIAATGANAGADQFPAIQKQLDDRRSAEIFQFQREFIPEVRALHFELLNRLKLGPPNRINPTFTAEAAEALNSGILMGQRPAGGVCDYLQNLAGRLKAAP